MARKKSAGSPRQRLLEVAERLFYAEGVHAVGIDRIIAEAGVAKASFYHHFRSKDDLVAAYLAEQSQAQRDKAADLPDGPPRARLMAIFDSVSEVARDPRYRGCPFVNAAAEFPDPDHPVRKVIADHRHWFRELLRDTLDGQPGAERTTDVLVALKDGLLVGADLDGRRSPDDVHAAVSAVLEDHRPRRRARS